MIAVALFAAMIFGAFLGVLVMALCHMAKDPDDNRPWPPMGNGKEKKDE